RAGNAAQPESVRAVRRVVDLHITQRAAVGQVEAVCGGGVDHRAWLAGFAVDRQVIRAAVGEVRVDWRRRPVGAGLDRDVVAAYGAVDCRDDVARLRLRTDPGGPR